MDIYLPFKKIISKLDEILCFFQTKATVGLTVGAPVDQPTGSDPVVLFDPATKTTYYWNGTAWTAGSAVNYYEWIGSVYMTGGNLEINQEYRNTFPGTWDTNHSSSPQDGFEINYTPNAVGLVDFTGKPYAYFGPAPLWYYYDAGSPIPFFLIMAGIGTNTVAFKPYVMNGNPPPSGFLDDGTPMAIRIIYYTS